jgi:hypothetical protein
MNAVAYIAGEMALIYLNAAECLQRNYVRRNLEKKLKLQTVQQSLQVADRSHQLSFLEMSSRKKLKLLLQSDLQCFLQGERSEHPPLLSSSRMELNNILHKMKKKKRRIRRKYT